MSILTIKRVFNRFFISTFDTLIYELAYYVFQILPQPICTILWKPTNPRI